MSTPTPPQDPQSGWQQPQQPYQGQPSQGQPSQGQPPAYGNAPSAPGGPVPGERPAQVTGAAITAVVIGGLGTLFGLLGLLVIGAVFELSALLGILQLVSFAIAIAVLVGGIQLLRGGDEKLLLTALYASIGLNLLFLLISLANGGFEFTGVLGFVIPIIIVFLLRQPASQAYLAGRRTT